MGPQCHISWRTPLVSGRSPPAALLLRLPSLLHLPCCAYPATPLFFFAQQMCTRKKKFGHSRVSKKHDNDTAEVSAREKKKITARQGKCLKKKKLAQRRVREKQEN